MNNFHLIGISVIIICTVYLHKNLKSTQKNRRIEKIII